ncbi:MAG: hypothetical protein H0T50_00585 [Gemmatimonadales bacterium]|nr:hypothetical protein [Gemmatimonadales bacterium]
MKQPGAKRLTGLLRDTAVVLVVSAGLLLGLELALRVLWPQTLSGTSLEGEYFSQADDSLGMRYAPGAVWRFRHPEFTVVYHINPDGFRDSTTHPPEKPAGTTRVLLLGDSFTFGYGVDYDSIWPVLAEEELRRQGRAIELVKAGVEGMDTRTELVLLHRLFQRYQPDAVVVGFLVNDLYSNSPYGRVVAATPVREPGFRLQEHIPRLHLLILARRLVTASDAGYTLLYMGAPQRGEFLRVPRSAAAERSGGSRRTCCA